ncbi:heterokaryon incompatibility protein-domain-containing protein [Diplogelasinospora grovesii]|uniref:Heterokaryon incompatibility protein-domain-containing protein n=1 Tax=Diplogelasinospora grovesii TaxID=303347 RepID=A0AAN6N4B7_9PEZI|nr:heterokaryon incompatibility protein-domain-containing protein [Diplogelasinospora grovesii]
MAPITPEPGLSLARLRELDLTDPGTTSKVRVMLETVISFCLNGLGCAVLEFASRSFGAGVLSRGLTPGALARSATWLHFNINRGFLESLRIYSNTDWSVTWLSKPRRPLFLVAARTATFAVSKFLLTKAAQGIFGTAGRVVHRALPGSLVAPFHVAVFLGIVWFLPTCEICSQQMTLAKTLAFLMTAPLDHAVSKRKTRIASTFIKAHNMSNVSERKRPYKYVPIGSHRAIRLLKLSPAGGDLVLASLHNYPLDGIPEYLAVSYIWGSSDMVCDLEISEDDGSRAGNIPITKSCQYVLFSLAPGGNEARYVWIDAVCINQEDPTEKETQIPLMGDIYRGASHVWCFPHGSTALPIGDFVRRLSFQLFREEDVRVTLDWGTQWAKTNPPPQGVLGWLASWSALSYLRNGSNIPLQRGWLDRESWIALRGILQNEYWRRAWIVQEIVLAKSLILVYGNNALTWDHLSLISKLLAGNQKRAPGKPLWTSTRACPNTHPSDKLKESERNVSRENTNGPTVAELIDLLRPLEIRATQPRDRIFSLLALCSDADAPAHKPTYDKATSDWDIYARTTSHSLRRGQLHLLLLAGLAYDYFYYALPEEEEEEGCPFASAMWRRPTGLPSWAPDLSRWREPREGNRKAVRARSSVSSFQLDLEVSPDLKRLSLRGILACTVVAVSPAEPMIAAAVLTKTNAPGKNGAGSNNWDMALAMAFVRVYDAARELLHKYRSAPDALGGRDEAFYRAMVMEDDPTTDGHSPAQLEAAVRSFVARNRNVVEGRAVTEGPEVGPGNTHSYPLGNDPIDPRVKWLIHYDP